jgi:hypothetical protein
LEPNAGKKETAPVPWQTTKNKKINEKGSSWISTWFYYRHKPGAEKHKLNLYAYNNLKYFSQCFFRSHSQTCFSQTKPLR